MARRVAVEIVGDASSLEKAFKKSERSAAKFNRDIGKMTRGAAAGSGIFRGLGRSVAFASGGFLAFASGADFLRKSVDAAREAAVAQRSLAAQMRAAGESFEANRERIEKVSLSYGKFGFQNDEVIQSLTVLERGTGDINKAIGLQGLAADLARAKNLDLAAAAQTVAKVFGGQETALRRAVPGLEKNAHGMDLIRLAQAKLAGQAEANTTAADRFHAVLHDTEEIIGTALLPTLNKYLETLSNWLQGMNRSGELQRDVAAAASVLKDAIDILKGAFDALNKITGSTKNTLKLLLTAFVAFKTLKIISAFTDIATSIGLVGTAAKTSRIELEALNKTPVLPRGLGAVGALGAAAAGGALAFGQQGETSPKPSGQLGVTWMADIVAYRDPVTGKYIMLSGKRASSAAEAQKLAEADFHRRHPGATLPGAGASGGKAPALPLPTTPGGLPTGPVPLLHPKAAAAAQAGFTLPLRFQLEQARAEATGVQAQIVKAAHDIAVFVAGIIPKLHGQKLLDAYQQFAQANGVVRDAVQQATEKTKETAAKAKQAAEAAAARAKAEAELARQFSVSLGLQVEQARAQALGRSLRPILKQIRAAAVKALKSGRLGLQGQLDAWNTIAEINQQLADHATNTKRVVKAAQFKGFGAVLPTTPTVFGAIVPGTASGFQIHELHLHGVQNVPQLENELLKRSKQRPHARRGP